MFIGLGLGINSGRAGGSHAFAFYNRWADSNGGAVFSFEDDSVYVRDPVTGANNYAGSAITFFKTIGSYSGSVKPTRRASGLWLPNTSGDLPYTWDASGNPLGYLPEESRTPRAAKSRRLDDASYWTASNVTTSATEGVDGITGSATRITASSNNGTILGTSNTLASAAHRLDPFVRRVSGTGTLEYTIDGGSTWTVITGITSSFQRLGGSQTVANPRLGFRIQSSGDSFDIDYANGETGAFATSPIESGTSPTARTADNASVATSVLPYSSTLLTAYFKAARLSNATSAGNLFQTAVSAPALADRDGGSLQSSLPTISYLVNSGTNLTTANRKVAFAYKAGDHAGCVDGGSVGTSANATSFSAVSRLYIGVNASGASQLNGSISMAAFFPQRISNANLQTMTA